MISKYKAVKRSAQPNDPPGWPEEAEFTCLTISRLTWDAILLSWFKFAIGTNRCFDAAKINKKRQSVMDCLHFGFVFFKFNGPFDLNV